MNPEHTKFDCQIRPSLPEDVAEAHIWIWWPTDELQNKFKAKRRALKVCCCDGKGNAIGKPIFAEVLCVDKGFQVRYNKSENFGKSDVPDLMSGDFVFSEHYRDRLGIVFPSGQWQAPLTATYQPARCCNCLHGLLEWWAKLHATRLHPQVAIRVGFWLGAISILLGLIGVVLGVIGLVPDEACSSRFAKVTGFALGHWVSLLITAVIAIVVLRFAIFCGEKIELSPRASSTSTPPAE